MSSNCDKKVHGSTPCPHDKQVPTHGSVMCWARARCMDFAQQWHQPHHCAQMHTGVQPKGLAHATGIRSTDTKAGMRSGISQKHNTRSKLYWFTEFCNSQRLSHFAVPFIVVRAETSIAESCIGHQSNLQAHIMHRG